MNFNDKVRAMALRLIGNNDAVKAATEPKVYIALLTQTGTDAPVATVLKNTLGGVPVWSYSNVGVYTGTLASAFTANKTITNINQAGVNLAFPEETGFKSFFRVNDNTVRIMTKLVSYDDANDLLDSVSIKIEVYP